jgi:hypothetical protein
MTAPDPPAMATPSATHGTVVDARTPEASVAPPASSTPVRLPAASPLALRWHQVVGTISETTWSPDGQHLLIQSDFNTSSEYILGVEIVDRGGTVVASYPKLAASFWLDADHLVGFRANVTSDDPSFNRVAKAFVAGLDGADPQPINIPAGQTLPNGRGAVAISEWDGPKLGGVRQYRFQVWSHGGLSSRNDGFPFAWSPDGTKLAVSNPVTSTMAVSGPLEVVSWPGLQIAYQDAPPDPTDYEIFDPTSTYIAFERLPQESDTSSPVIRVAAFEGRDPVDVQALRAPPRWSWFWEGATLDVIDRTRTLTRYSPSGAITSSGPAAGDVGIASRDGSTVLFYGSGSDTPSTDVIVERLGTTRVVELPFWPFDPSALLSPDGTAIADVGEQELYVATL